MFQDLFVLLKLSLCTFACLFVSPVSAQVTTDGTVNTQVNTNGNVSEITGGQTRGDNLFHSFQDFSVPTNNEAFFNNADDIANIFSRVTGGNISNIDGLIRANGSASLFLINPAGILFGEGARLDIGGSFYGSTADSILFEDGEFSATDLDSPPLLTINAPIGLNFRDNPAEIINRSVVQNNNAEEITGLEVSSGNNLTLVGGDLRFEGGNLTANGGRIELGGLSQAGTVTFNGDGSLSFPTDVAKADLTLSNAAEVDVTGTGGGDVAINARNLNLEGGEFGDSVIVAGINPDSTDPEAIAGDITINATDNVTVDNSIIANLVEPEAVGNGGDVTITTDTLSLIDAGQVGASTLGQGNAGSVEITATDNITIDGKSSQGFIGGIYSTVSAVAGEAQAVGNAGDLTITTGSLSLSSGGQISTSTYGIGNAGSVEIVATDAVTIDGENSQFIPTAIGSQVGPGAVGDAGDVTITTNSLSLTNGATVTANTFSQGNAGDVIVNASSTIDINGATETVNISGATQTNPSGLFAEALIGNGNGGNINISTDLLTINDGGTIRASNFDSPSGSKPGTGEPGNISIEANNLSLSNNASIDAATQSETGNSANINLQIDDNLTLENSSYISAQAFEEADGGELSIDAEFIVAFPNGSNDLIAGAERGQGGNIIINAESILGIEERPLSATTNDINASSSVSGLDGTVDITTPDINPIQGATELPSNLVVPEQTTAQVCQSDREVAAQNGLTVKGKGGVPPAPDSPLDSQDITIEEEYTDSISVTAQPVETSKGKIQPARGIRETEKGVILTAYRTSNSGDRIIETRNCGQT